MLYAINKVSVEDESSLVKPHLQYGIYESIIIIDSSC